MLRLDALEAAMAARPGPRAAARRRAPGPRRPPGRAAAGVAAPQFDLDRLEGGTSSTAELLALGQPLALAFVDPACGPCGALLPELVRWPRKMSAQVTLAIVTTGSVESNSSKLAGRLGHVLLQSGREVAEAYRAYGTPSMVVVDADGTIGSPVAEGSDAIRGLMAGFAGSGAAHQSTRCRHGHPWAGPPPA